jgi:hypothetical protein
VPLHCCRLPKHERASGRPATWKTPRLGPRVGHRILIKPLPGAHRAAVEDIRVPPTRWCARGYSTGPTLGWFASACACSLARGAWLSLENRKEVGTGASAGGGRGASATASDDDGGWGRGGRGKTTGTIRPSGVGRARVASMQVGDAAAAARQLAGLQFGWDRYYTPLDVPYCLVLRDDTRARFYADGESLGARQLETCQDTGGASVLLY